MNWAKSSLEPGREKVFIGYIVNTLGSGLIMPTKNRQHAVDTLVVNLLQRKKATARQVAKLTGHLVSLRYVLDPMALLFTRNLYMWVVRTDVVWGRNLLPNTLSKMHNKQ